MLFDTFDTNSNYNALQAKVTKRLSKGFQALISYTYSKVLNQNGGNSDNGCLCDQQNENNRRADYGLAGFDIRQRLVLSPIWQLPFGVGQPFLDHSGVMNALVGGWELSAIVTFQS